MKPFRSKKRQTIVVDIGQGTIKMAATESVGDANRFRGITRIALPDGVHFEDADLTLVADQMRAEVLRNGWEGFPTACLLSQRATSTHTYLLPKMPEEEMRQAIELRLTETLHFDVEDAVFDFKSFQDPKDPESKMVMVFVVVARKDALHRNLEVIRQAGLNPVSVSAASESLANLTIQTRPKNLTGASVHIDLGANSTVINLFDGRVLRFSREIDITGDSFAEALMRPIISGNQVINLDRDQADEILLLTGYPQADIDMDLPHDVHTADILPLMTPVAQKLSTEIRRSIDYLNGLLERTGAVEIMLSGSSGSMPNLDYTLEENLNMPVHYVDPVAHAIAHWRLSICDNDQASPPGFSNVLGYSLGQHKPVNLLALEEAANVAKQRATRDQRTRATVTLALMACLAIAAFPLDRKYVNANRLTRITSGNLDREILEQADAMVYWASFQGKAQKVTQARGPVPDWSGVMKELGSILPESAQIVTLTSRQLPDSVSVDMVARVHPGLHTTRSTLTQMSEALNNSPFFDKVRITQASVPFQGVLGRFEATFEIITPPISAVGPIQ